MIMVPDVFSIRIETARARIRGLLVNTAKQKDTQMIRSISLAALSLLAVAGVARATEGGGSVYPHGAEGHLTAAVPPPGVYGMVYGHQYSANRLNDAAGENLGVPGFKIRANSITPRFVWIPGTKIMGGDLALHTTLPLVDLKVSAMGMSQSKSGLGDVLIGAAVGHHHSANLHTVWVVDVTLPTGGYTKGDLANIGRNYFAIDPAFGVTYVDPNGFNGDMRVGYLINQRNEDTDYTSGQEFHFDYALGWGFGNGWTVGVGGYYKKQTTLDKQGSLKLGDSKTSGMAIGPSIKYDSGRGWFLTAKWQKESNVKNGSEGSALWLKAVFPL